MLWRKRKQKLGIGSRGMVPGSSVHLKESGEDTPMMETCETVMKEGKERDVQTTEGRIHRPSRVEGQSPA